MTELICIKKLLAAYQKKGYFIEAECECLRCRAERKEKEEDYGPELQGN